jgi:hypothetical protein
MNSKKITYKDIIKQVQVLASECFYEIVENEILKIMDTADVGWQRSIFPADLPFNIPGKFVVGLGADGEDSVEVYKDIKTGGLVNYNPTAYNLPPRPPPGGEVRVLPIYSVEWEKEGSYPESTFIKELTRIITSEELKIIFKFWHLEIVSKHVSKSSKDIAKDFFKETLEQVITKWIEHILLYSWGLDYLRPGYLRMIRSDPLPTELEMIQYEQFKFSHDVLWHEFYPRTPPPPYLSGPHLQSRRKFPVFKFVVPDPFKTKPWKPQRDPVSGVLRPGNIYTVNGWHGGYDQVTLNVPLEAISPYWNFGWKMSKLRYPTKDVILCFFGDMERIKKEWGYVKFIPGLLPFVPGGGWNPSTKTGKGRETRVKTPYTKEAALIIFNDLKTILLTLDYYAIKSFQIERVKIDFENKSKIYWNAISTSVKNYLETQRYTNDLFPGINYHEMVILLKIIAMSNILANIMWNYDAVYSSKGNNWDREDIDIQSSMINRKVYRSVYTQKTSVHSSDSDSGCLHNIYKLYILKKVPLHMMNYVKYKYNNTFNLPVLMYPRENVDEKDLYFQDKTYIDGNLKKEMDIWIRDRINIFISGSTNKTAENFFYNIFNYSRFCFMDALHSWGGVCINEVVELSSMLEYNFLKDDLYADMDKYHLVTDRSEYPMSWRKRIVVEQTIVNNWKKENPDWEKQPRFKGFFESDEWVSI